MAVTSDPILINGQSFVTKTEGETATVVRTATGKAISQTEKETAGDYYNSSSNEIDYAKIYNLKFGANWISKMGASDDWMAQAQTNPAFKNAFKKSTGETGPNLSFASIAEANLNWEPTSINKNANGKSTVNKGSGTLYYPISKDKKKYDYLKVTALEYAPNTFGSGEGVSGGFGVDIEDRANTTPIGTVFLPMQPGLADQSSVNWNNSEVNALDAAAANIAGNTADAGSKGIVDTAKEFVDSTKEQATKVAGSINKNDITGYFAGKAIGKDIFTRTTGQVLNPNLELLFSGPQLRSFNYNYKFTPREEAEAKMIRKIIRFFKKNMSPKREKAGAVFLKSPNIFRLEYIFKEGGQHPFLNKIKLCALQSCNTQYTPDGNYATYDDGSMTSYSMGLQFGEISPIFDTDYDDSDNDMGY